MQRSLRLVMPPEQGEYSAVLSPIENVLEEMAAAENWPVTLTMRANLILEELVLNTFTHGAAGGLTAVELELDFSDETLTIRITDDGAPFNPLEDAPDPDLTLSLAERPIGGLGLHLVRSLGKDLEYRNKNGRNHLKLAVIAES
ncbi:ATP-binding protein [Candidatus Poriferisocius sp.]|uniref:ATP-binding protein n=1 Tax=Candidatus Poriferisocius sp. TaxID=3101276 RepID=UPI003B017305